MSTWVEPGVSSEVLKFGLMRTFFPLNGFELQEVEALLHAVGPRVGLDQDDPRLARGAGPLGQPDPRRSQPRPRTDASHRFRRKRRDSGQPGPCREELPPRHFFAFLHGRFPSEFFDPI